MTELFDQMKLLFITGKNPVTAADQVVNSLSGNPFLLSHLADLVILQHNILINLFLMFCQQLSIEVVQHRLLYYYVDFFFSQFHHPAYYIGQDPKSQGFF